MRMNGKDKGRGAAYRRKAAAHWGLIWAAAVLLACGGNDAGFTLEAGSTGEDDMPVEVQRLDALAMAYDGDPTTRWTTNVPMRPWFYVAIHLKKPRRVRTVILDAHDSPNDHPRRFVVEVAREGEGIREVARGTKKNTRKGVTRIDLDPEEEVDLIMITVQDTRRYFWSIHELEIEYAD
jgi:hypothetical protein